MNDKETEEQYRKHPEVIKVIEDMSNSFLQNVSCFYLVLHHIDYEGIQEEMYLFNDLERAKNKLDELNLKIREWEDEKYYIKEINCN